MWIDTTASEKLELGNINTDSSVNSVDAAQILTASANKGVGIESGLNALQEEAADVNADGTFDAVDAALILQYSSEFGTGTHTGTFVSFLNNTVYCYDKK